MQERAPPRSSDGHIESHEKVFRGMGEEHRKTVKAMFNSKFVKMAIVQCYASTNDSAEEKEDFYLQFQAANDKIPKHNGCIIMGDFNAKVGSDNSTF